MLPAPVPRMAVIVAGHARGQGWLNRFLRSRPPVADD
jgi:hypothetical protein